MHLVPTKTLTPIKTRLELGNILENENLTSGVELGVKRGIFSEAILNRWRSARLYVLVDLWAQQENYGDIANVDTTSQLSFKRETMRRMQKYIERGTKIEFCHSSTTRCAGRYSKQIFDFIYVDARHDYKGVYQDLSYWWPLVKTGGIMAGHDYVTNSDGPIQSKQNWTVNYDGTVDLKGRAVKGAVDDFMMERGIQVAVTYRESAWNTWIVRKP